MVFTLFGTKACCTDVGYHFNTLLVVTSTVPGKLLYNFCLHITSGLVLHVHPWYGLVQHGTGCN